MTHRTVFCKNTLKTLSSPIPAILGRILAITTLTLLSFFWVCSVVFGALSLITNLTLIYAKNWDQAVYHFKWLLFIFLVFVISTLLIKAIATKCWREE
jgi:hypothetical protein